MSCRPNIDVHCLWCTTTINVDVCYNTENEQWCACNENRYSLTRVMITIIIGDVFAVTSVAILPYT